MRVRFDSTPSTKELASYAGWPDAGVAALVRLDQRQQRRAKPGIQISRPLAALRAAADRVGSPGQVGLAAVAGRPRRHRDHLRAWLSSSIRAALSTSALPVVVEEAG